MIACADPGGIRREDETPPGSRLALASWLWHNNHMRRTYYITGRFALAALACLGLAAACVPLLAEELPAPAAALSADAPAILVFSKTAGYRHDSISAGIAAIEAIGAEHGLRVDKTENASQFNDQTLAGYRAVVFLSTTGDVLNSTQQAAFERFIQAGGGYAGVHSASDTEYNWAWYGGLLGAYFDQHPAIQEAALDVVDADHPSTSGLPARWERRDEWYNFRSLPPASARVLLTIDEASYSGGTMGEHHPMSWAQLYDGGRSWYTALGHTSASYSEPLFRAHLAGGILWAAGLSDPATPTPSPSPSSTATLTVTSTSAPTSSASTAPTASRTTSASTATASATATSGVTTTASTASATATIGATPTATARPGQLGQRLWLALLAQP